MSSYAHTVAALVPRLFAAASLALLLAGCSDAASSPDFAKCGNGHLDAGEQCDDGNLLDNDDCLSTCVRATCGDTYVNSTGNPHEDCDTRNLNGETCASLGYVGQNPNCSIGCLFDLSTCGARFTPTPTRTSTPVPTATPTPPAACINLKVTVTLAYNVSAVPEVGTLSLNLGYPTTVSIPGTGADSSVYDRVTDLTGVNGFLQLNDDDANPADAKLETSYDGGTTSIPAADFEEVKFDCQSGTMPPVSESFPCTVAQATDLQGQPVNGVTCRVRVAAE